MRISIAQHHAAAPCVCVCVQSCEAAAAALGPAALISKGNTIGKYLSATLGSEARGISTVCGAPPLTNYIIQVCK